MFVSSLLAFTALLASPASACGGFFCNTEAPVDQAGETIVFEVDEESETVTMHVQVEYEGPSESFAWVIPVSGTPDLFTSHDVLFQRLHDLTRPYYGVDYRDVGCENRWNGVEDASSDGDDDDSSFTDAGTYPPSAGGVQVLESNTVGAFETVTLSAENADALVTWLQLNDYDVPSEMSKALAPYVAGGMNFVALKLAKDADTGDLTPLGLRYEGTTPVVPLTITAIAATPDMPMTVYLLGDARGVPLNYLHVGLNPLAIDYWRGGDNIDDVITRGADEAGGQAFATESAQKLNADNLLYRDGMFSLDQVVQDDPAIFVVSLPGAGFSGTPEVLEVLRDFVPMPEGFPDSEQDFYNFPSSYPEWYAMIEWDGPGAVAALDARVVQPLVEAQAMLDRSPWLTRLRSSVSPEEMTLDPFFSFNPDLPPVAPSSWVEVVRDCTGALNASSYEVAQQLIYPRGQRITIPSEKRLAEMGITPFEYVQEYSDFAALVIEQLDVKGPPEVLVDRSDQVLPQDPLVGDEPAEAGGCGCTTAPSAMAAWLAPLLLLVGASRRRTLSLETK